MKLEEVLEDCLDTPSWGDLREIEYNSVNSYGNTPLHTVCTWGDLKSVELLIEAGADVNYAGERGHTPLFSAIVGQNAEVVEYLLKKGADKSKRNEWGSTPLSQATNVSADPKIIKLLK